MQIQGLLPIIFSIEYNSLLLKPGLLGWGWDMRQFTTRLEPLNLNTIRIHWTANRYNDFIYQGNNQYLATHSHCQFDSLAQQTDGGFTLSRRNQNIYTFNPQGQLITFGNRQGQSLSSIGS